MRASSTGPSGSGSDPSLSPQDDALGFFCAALLETEPLIRDGIWSGSHQLPRGIAEAAGLGAEGKMRSVLVGIPTGHSLF